jgi:arsenate reductase
MVPPDDTPGGVRGDRPRLRGRAVLKPIVPSAPAKKRVLFVCIGNSCRSQMAEAFARSYGSDVMLAQSAGTHPATIIQPLTVRMVEERNLKVDGQFPKELTSFAKENFDLVVNMSGRPVTLGNARVVEWKVPDPIGQKEAVYREVAGQIEGLVMGLILMLRSGRMPA